jgi:hypothetical protein
LKNKQHLDIKKDFWPQAKISPAAPIGGIDDSNPDLCRHFWCNQTNSDSECFFQHKLAKFEASGRSILLRLKTTCSPPLLFSQYFLTENGYRKANVQATQL